MPERSASNQVRLGLFVLVGLSCLLLTLYLLGSRQSLFDRSITVQADFRNVAGLLPGNNVRLGGITVGNVRKIRLLNDSTVRVALRLNHAVEQFVRRNTVATIGTDGLVGNTIINLTAQPAPASLIRPGDVLPTTVPVSLDDLFGTLQLSNKNLVGVTQDLRQITGKLNGSKALWQLLSDEQLATDARQSLRQVAAASAQLHAASQDVAQLTRGVRQGRGPAGYLLTDTAFGSRLGHAARQLAGTSDTLAATLGTLRHQAATPGGPLNTLLTDTATARQLRQSIRHVEQGTAGFSRSMDALQHNFLLRGYLRRQARKQAQVVD
jgi:phospholipid/cholesterol/gamma-HCH transport system substrate-binding protein